MTRAPGRLHDTFENHLFVMKLVSYLKDDQAQLAVLVDDILYDMELIHPDTPGNMGMFLNYWDDLFPIVQAAALGLGEGQFKLSKGTPVDGVQILAPVPFPPSCRDGYAFRQHVAAARRNRKVPMIPEFDQYPIFYFTNHHSIQGPGDIRCMPDHFEKLDFELEVAIVIGRPGRNIPAAEADNHIAGLMIMNDVSARTLQMEEMLLNLGPAKGKDFSTVTGPWLVTTDELAEFEVPCKEGHTGSMAFPSATAISPTWTGPLPRSSKEPLMGSTSFPEISSVAERLEQAASLNSTAPESSTMPAIRNNG